MKEEEEETKRDIKKNSYICKKKSGNRNKYKKNETNR